VFTLLLPSAVAEDPVVQPVPGFATSDRD
jgi:hypothetical protein